MRNYVPDQCREMLEHLGAVFDVESAVGSAATPSVPENWHKAMVNFLRIFSRNSGATEGVIKLKLGNRHHLFKTRILPLLLKHEIVRQTDYVGQGEQERFELCFPVDTILKGEDPVAFVPKNISEFWVQVREQS